ANLQTSTDPLRLVEAALLGLLFLAAVAVLSLPAARTASAQLGWVSLWLLGLPAAALAMARWLAWSRLRTVDTPAPAAMAPARRRRASVVPARRRAAPRRQARPLAEGLSRGAAGGAARLARAPSGPSAQHLRRFAADDHHVRRAAREQAHADHAGDLVEPLLHHHRIDDLQAVHVEHPVAVVGDHA